jgi:hypothetical protein
VFKVTAHWRDENSGGAKARQEVKHSKSAGGAFLARMLSSLTGIG